MNKILESTLMCVRIATESYSRSLSLVTSWCNRLQERAQEFFMRNDVMTYEQGSDIILHSFSALHVDNNKAFSALD